jgi:5'-nucleotidase
MRSPIQFSVRGLVVLTMLLAASSATAQLRVLVTNDDGVGAPGIDAVVQQLIQNPDLEVTVVAPLTNQSGSGDTFSTTPLAISSTTTASGYPASAVAGRPADAVLVALLDLLAEPPDLVVSGINSGQNITREIANLSGTVGAALTAARKGIPAIALSQGFPASDFADAARYAANLVDRLERSRSLRRRFLSRERPGTALVLSVNWPSCPSGGARGVELVPLAFGTTVTGYDPAGAGFVQAVVQTRSFFVTPDCTSTLTNPADDHEAFANGFASATPLNPDKTIGARLSHFRFAERIDF